MKFITTTQPDGSSVELFYQDIGTGKPVIFIHGWPLNSMMWQYQLAELPEYGIRCIAYDRRGFGRSSHTWDGYDYDTLADDLKAVIDDLELKDVTLVAFSMGGGEVVRYFTRHKGANVSKVVLVSSVVPYMMLDEYNPTGIQPETVDDMISGLNRDHASYLAGFNRTFYGVNIINHPVSQNILDWTFLMEMQASLKATIECVYSFTQTDFRDELDNINVPVLLIHGDNDKTVPIEPTSESATELLPDAELVIYEDEPHGIFYTAKDQLNTDLLDFILEREQDLDE